MIAQTNSVTKCFGEAIALDEISLDIPEGQLLGILGPNGAGKTTLIELLVGLRMPTSGSVTVGGADPRSETARRLFGLTAQETGLPETWRVREAVDFVAAHYPDPMPTDQLLARFDLIDLSERQIGSLSGGQQRRLAVALAFTGRPRIVFLDEPTTGLDVQARRALWDGIRQFHAEGGSVVLTSHYIEEIEALAERVIVLDHGRILADGPVAQIRGRVRLKRVTLNTDTVPSLAHVTKVEQQDHQVHLLTTDASALVRELVTVGAQFDDIEIHTATLEDAFLALTRDRSAA